MSIFAMRVAEATEHLNADTLRIYTFEAPGVAPTTVIANLENVYQPGDVVAVARVGAVLRDGSRIRASKIRGVHSFGMALGAVEAEPGDDLTERFGQEAVETTVPTAAFSRWPSIALLHAMRRELVETHEVEGTSLPRITYRAKVKLDGTNAAVAVLPEGVAAQSRSRWIVPEDDNMGFATWLRAQSRWSEQLRDSLEHAVIYGEWAGDGIQRRTAVSTLERRVFAVFAVQFGDVTREAPRIVVDPEAIAALLPEHPDVHVLPWHGNAVDLDFARPDALDPVVESLNAVVDRVEACDPWVAATFGREGMGEGIVCYPTARDGASLLRDGSLDRELLSALMFKAKGAKHQTVRQKKAVQVGPEVVASIEAFVKLVLTPARLEQGVTEAAAGTRDPVHTGEFLSWIALDVRKETVAELEAAGLVWKQVRRPLGLAARDWYLGRR